MHSQWLAPDVAGIAAAAALIRDGETVAVPTETVYGLAARADRDGAVAAIYRAKGRPDFNPLIVHVSDLAAAETLALIDADAARLAHAFWPGPLTMVLPRRAEAPLSLAVSAGLPSVALRCPAHPVMRALLDRCAVPLAAPSANPSGAVSPTTAAHVLAGLDGRIAAVLDGGPCAQGLESTIVALRGAGRWSLLRPGPIARAALAAVLGAEGETAAGSAIEAPGQLTSHYAPGKPLRLNAQAGEPDEFMIGFGTVPGHVSLSPGGDPAEAAARLYACLHAAAAAEQPRAAVAPVPPTGIGEAINDRLRRAAA